MMDSYLFSIALTIVMISSQFSGCGTSHATKQSSVYPTKGQTEKVENDSRKLILEVLRDEDGSVPIRGEHVFFKLFDDGFYEFDYLVTEKPKPEYPRFSYSHQRTSPTELSEHEFDKFKSLLKDLSTNKETKKEYPRTGYGFDVSINLKVHLIVDGNIEKEIITNTSDVVIMKRKEKFPRSLVRLIEEIHDIRSKFTEKDS